MPDECSICDAKAKLSALVGAVGRLDEAQALIQRAISAVEQTATGLRSQPRAAGSKRPQA